jgi:transposase
MDQPGPRPRVVFADKGYDADFILADLEARGVAAVIPAKRNRKIQPVIDGHIYALRNLVERCFPKLKHSRRLTTRYDKTADSFLGWSLQSGCGSGTLSTRPNPIKCEMTPHHRITAFIPRPDPAP